jgi:hypothetical protein
VLSKYFGSMQKTYCHLSDKKNLTRPGVSTSKVSHGLLAKVAKKHKVTFRGDEDFMRSKYQFMLYVRICEISTWEKLDFMMSFLENRPLFVLKSISKKGLNLLFNTSWIEFKKEFSDLLQEYNVIRKIQKLKMRTFIRVHATSIFLLSQMFTALV